MITVETYIEVVSLRLCNGFTHPVFSWLMYLCVVDDGLCVCTLALFHLLVCNIIFAFLRFILCALCALYCVCALFEERSCLGADVPRCWGQCMAPHLLLYKLKAGWSSGLSCPCSTRSKMAGQGIEGQIKTHKSDRMLQTF